MSNIIGWTDERVKELKLAWAAGLSCTVIGAQLGVSRNAVIGKISRLGLSGRKVVVTPEQREARRQRDNAARVVRHRNARQQKKGEIKMERSPSIVSPMPGYEALNIPFSQLRDFKNGEPNQCRFIAVDVTGPDTPACGNETEAGKSYCAHCAEKMRQKPLTHEERVINHHKVVRNHQRSLRKAA
jgi:GcrA cell cycle regulator